MPRLNSIGSAVVATSGGPVSIDGAIPGALAGVTAAGGWSWLDDDTAVGLGDSGGGVELLQYVVSTTTLSVLDPVASDRSVAGGGTWAVEEATTGVSTSVAGLGPLVGAGVLDASATGELAIVLGLATTRGVRVYDAAGAEVVTLDSVLTSLEVRLRGGRLCFQDAAGWHLWDLADASFDTFAQRTTVPTITVPALLTAGTVVLVERTATQLTVRQAAAGVGYVLAGVVVDPDAIELSPGVVRVAWASNVAQLAAQLVVADVNIAAGQITVGTVVSGAIVFGATTVLAAVQIPADTAAITVTLDALLRQPLVDRASIITQQWVRWYAAVQRLLSGPVDFARGVTGVLAQANGGTGNTVGAVQNAFGIVAVATESDVVAKLPSDRLTLVEGVGIAIVTNAATRAVAIAATGASGFPDATYLTVNDETADLPNSRRELPGTSITFDDSVPGERTINATGGGGLVFLRELVAASSAALDFTTDITSTYDDYLLVVDNLMPGFAGGDINILVSTDGGVTWITTSSYSYSYVYHGPATATAQYNSTGVTTGVPLSTISSSNLGTSGSVHLLGVHQVTPKKSFNVKTNWEHNTGPARLTWDGAGWFSGAAINAIRIINNVGFPATTLLSGAARLYGYAK